MSTQTLTTALTQAWVEHLSLSAAAWPVPDEAQAYAVHDGLGLGLVISRDIVTSFGGELTLAAGAGGAVFKIVLAKVP